MKIKVNYNNSSGSGGSGTRGIGALGVVQIVFIILKLIGTITWPWKVVLIPLWIDLVATLVALILVLIGVHNYRT